MRFINLYMSRFWFLVCCYSFLVLNFKEQLLLQNEKQETSNVVSIHFFNFFTNCLQLLIRNIG